MFDFQPLVYIIPMITVLEVDDKVIKGLVRAWFIDLQKDLRE